MKFVWFWTWLAMRILSISDWLGSVYANQCMPNASSENCLVDKLCVSFYYWEFSRWFVVFFFQNEKLKQEFIISRQQHQSCLEEVCWKGKYNVEKYVNQPEPKSTWTCRSTYFVWLSPMISRSRPFAYLLRTRGQMATACIERANLWLKM